MWFEGVRVGPAGFDVPVHTDTVSTERVGTDWVGTDWDRIGPGRAGPGSERPFRALRMDPEAARPPTRSTALHGSQRVRAVQRFR